jgi:hypothetical protein
MILISVDIGLRNFAIVKVQDDSDSDHTIGQDFKGTKINFHVYTKRTRSGPVERCEWIRRIVTDEDFNSADVVIIEQQVQRNTWAMNLMYAMISLIDGPEVILFRSYVNLQHSEYLLQQHGKHTKNFQLRWLGIF